MTRQLPPDLHALVEHTFAIAMTHAVDEVRDAVVQGIGEYLTVSNRPLALRCVHALAQIAIMIAHELSATPRAMRGRRRELEEIKELAAITIRAQIFPGTAIPPSAFDEMDMTVWSGAEATAKIVPILRHCPDDPIAIGVFRRVAETLITWWDGERRRPGPETVFHQGHDRATANRLQQELTSYLYRASDGVAADIADMLLPVIDRDPQRLTWILSGIVGGADDPSRAARFWMLWSRFSHRVRHAPWVRRVDDGDSHRQLLGPLFLKPVWISGHPWPALAGHEPDLDALFDALPATAPVFQLYLGYLLHLSTQALPVAFLRIARTLTQGDATVLLGGPSTIQYLERLLLQTIYTKPHELKRDQPMRQAIILILDRLVDAGSSSGFQMRDDFVTPPSS